MKKILKVLAVIMSVLLIPALYAACSSKEQEPELSISLDKTSVELTVGGNVEVLTLSVNGTLNEELEWTSSNPEVASVTANRNKATVKGVSAGAAVVSVKAGDLVAVCAVAVNPGSYINLNKTEINLFAGRTAVITADTNVTTALNYSSNNQSVASVSPSGLVSAHSGGVAKITVSGGNASATCMVYVTESYVTLSEEVVQLTLDEEGPNTVQLVADSNCDVVWTSSNEDVATVEDGLVTAVENGETTITVTALYGSATAECIVIVTDEILTVTISKDGEEVKDTVIIQPNESVTLAATVSPEQEGDNANVIWSVESGENVVSVSENGVVTSLGNIYGNAVIRATSVKNSHIYKECSVTVPDPYAGWLEITDKASLEAALKSGNESVNMRLMGDIDLDGATLNSTMGVFKGTFEGNGYEIMNFTCKGLFGGIFTTGTVKNLAVTCTTGRRGGDYDGGLFGEYIIGKVENCRFDITVNGDNMSAIAHHVLESTEITNTIFIIRNPQNKSNVYGGFFLDGHLNTACKNSYMTVLDGDVYTVFGPTQKTEAELKQASLYAGWDESIWQIEDGSIPVLKNDGNIGEVRVILDRETENVYVGGTINLVATVKPVKLPAADKAVIWESSNPAVATVDENGVVTALKAGEAVITATSVKDGTKFASCTVTVVAPSGNASIKLALAARSVGVGYTYQIDYTANGGFVSWSSSNPSVATVNSDGVVSGVAVGKTVITAKVGNKSETMIIHVYEKAAGAIEVSTAEDFKKMGSGTYYIVNDIDLGGATVDTLSEWVKVDGLGYKVSNFKTPKLFTWFQGYMKNIEISCVLNGDGNLDGLFGNWIGGVDGTVENCIFDITFSGNANQCGLVHHNNGGTIRNVIIKVSIENGSSGQKFPAFYETPNSSTVKNVFVLKGNGSYSAINGATEKTEAQLKSATTFDESWEEGWVIVDGEMPKLKGALVTEPLKVKLDKTSDELFVGEELTLTATVTPTELTAEERAITWVSEDPTVATVDQNGVVTAVKNGTVVIKAVSVKDANVYATFTLTVKAIEISINSEDKITELKLNGTKQLNVTVNCGEYTWETSNSSVATVENGLITAVSAGTVTITVRSANDPTKYDSITIEVKATVQITVELSDTTLSLDRDATATLTATVGNSDNGVTWTSDNEEVATVDQDGKVTTHSVNGTATITATSNDDDGNGNYATATCVVTVTYVPVEITLEKQSYNLFLDGTLNVADIASVNKGELVPSVVSGNGVVSIANGVITATGAGTATVRLTSSISYDDVTAVHKDINITVTIPQVAMSINATKRSLHVGGSGSAWTLEVTLDPMPGSPVASDVVWTSSNPSAISVVGGYSGGKYTGKLTTSSAGKATITATRTVDGTDYTVTCEINSFVANGSWNAVDTPEKLKTIAAPGTNWYLANDLDFAETEITSCYINTLDSVKLDGRGYSIKNIKTNFDENETGFIGTLTGLTVLENINFIGFNIGGSDKFMYGGLIKETTGTATIRNCYFEGVISARRGGNDIYVGTIGTMHNASNKIENCLFNVGLGTVAPNGAKNNNPKAILGRNFANEKVENCYAFASTSADKMLASAMNGAETGYGTFKTDEELKASSTFDGWTAWVVADGEYPRLAGDWEE